MEHSPQCTDILPLDNSLVKFLNKEDCKKRAQDLPTHYRLNGAIYICKTSSLLKQETFELNENIFGFKMKQEASIDIDSKLDFLIAQTILENN